MDKKYERKFTKQDIFNEIYCFCNIDNLDTIKEEIENIIDGYKLKEVKYGEDIICNLKDNRNNDISIDATKKYIHIVKTTKDKKENIFVYPEKLKLTSNILEKRPFGLVYSIIEKNFTKKHIFNKECVLDKLIEYRFLFTKETLISLVKNFDFENDALIQGNLMILDLTRSGGQLESKCDYYNEFSTCMNKFMWMDNSPRLTTNNKYSNITFINGEDYSNIYDIVDGYDKLYRIYDLYNGRINERNKQDINAIELGFIKKDAYDLKSLLGIKEKEDFLIGTSNFEETHDYLDRNSILQSINDDIPINKKESISNEVPANKIFQKKLRKIFNKRIL